MEVPITQGEGIMFEGLHVIWDHTVLPATRQRWESRLYPRPKQVLDLATLEGCKTELTYVTWPVSRKSNALLQRHHATQWITAAVYAAKTNNGISATAAADCIASAWPMSRQLPPWEIRPLRCGLWSKFSANMLLLTVDVFLLGRADLLGGGLADGLGQSLAGQAVLGRYDAVDDALSGNVGTVEQLVDVHDLFDELMRLLRDVQEQYRKNLADPRWWWWWWRYWRYW